MNGFFIYFYENIIFFFFLFILIGIFYLIIFKKYIYSIFDPLVLWLIGLIFATTDIFFMYFVKMIRSYYLIHYILTQSAMILGFLIFKPINKSKIIQVKSISQNLSFNQLDHFIYIFSSIIFITTQLYVYKIAGIPLFMESRLGTFSGGSGFGIFSRFLDISSMVTIYYLIGIFFDDRKNKRNSLYDILCLGFYLVTLFLSGSKSGVLRIVHSIFFYQLLQYKKGHINNKLKKSQKFFFVLAILGALLTIAVSLGNDGSLYNLWIRLSLRFVKNGDGFMLAYPNDVLFKMSNANPFLVIFKDFLGLFRIFRWDQLPQALGIELYRYYHDTEVLMGPNPRHNMFGLLYFGYFTSVFYSFFIGFLISYIRNFLYKKVKLNYIGELFYFILATLITGINMDIALTLLKINNLLVVFIPLVCCVNIVYYVLRQHKIKQEK